ncbi:MAG TPA: YbhB/YbcL family Raf kinase inhibitor-like protein [Bryobacteraceae bacterium]|nr:YbhB/YbcL family Raf kinase inhibitor-like protein [Bryobacteraceae bacterium]
MAFQLFSPGFVESGWIPELHTCQGADISPSLEWSGEPGETRSFALLLEDPDAPGGIWTHWLLWDIPPKVHNLAQGLKPGTLGVSGRNDFQKLGYGGPCPPKGHGAHRYFFKLYALNVPTLSLAEGSSKRDVEKATKDHVLAQTQYMGRYERR